MNENNNEQKGFESVSDIFSQKQPKKSPVYKWQDLALRIIKELNIPNFKRSSVFKACRDNSEQYILNCLNDTKELCQTGDKWKYFFKLVSEQKIKK